MDGQTDGQTARQTPHDSKDRPMQSVMRVKIAERSLGYFPLQLGHVLPRESGCDAALP